MDNLYNESSEIWKSGLSRTNNVITKINKSKMKCLISNVSISGEKNDILCHLKHGPSTNLINSFFKVKTENCDICKIKKDQVIQLDRAHCNNINCDRISLLKIAINKFYIDSQKPIKIKLILIEFLKLHTKIPLFILCKKCHIKYDKKN